MCGANQNTVDRLFVLISASLIKHKRGITITKASNKISSSAAYEAEWISVWGLWITEALKENQFFIFIMCKWPISEGNALTLTYLRLCLCLTLPEGSQAMRWDYSYASGIRNGLHDVWTAVLWCPHLLPLRFRTHSRLTAPPGKVTQASDSVQTLSFVFVPCSGWTRHCLSLARFQTCCLSLTAFLA